MGTANHRQPAYLAACMVLLLSWAPAVGSWNDGPPRMTEAERKAYIDGVHRRWDEEAEKEAAIDRKIARERRRNASSDLGTKLVIVGVTVAMAGLSIKIWRLERKQKELSRTDPPEPSKPPSPPPQRKPTSDRRQFVPPDFDESDLR